MDKAFVFIDGAYLSKITKHYKNGLYKQVDLKQFAHTISKEFDFWCEGLYYYTAPPFQDDKPTKDQADKKSKYDKFTNKIKKLGVIVREGRCQKVDGKYKQKGVDTLLTMDLFKEPLEKKIKNIIILTSDTDFVPILNAVRKTNIKVVLCYYSDFNRNSMFSMSNHLFSSCDEKLLLKEEHFKKSLLTKE